MPLMSNVPVYVTYCKTYWVQLANKRECTCSKSASTNVPLNVTAGFRICRSSQDLQTSVLMTKVTGRANYLKVLWNTAGSLHYSCQSHCWVGRKMGTKRR